jgi:phosphoribosylformylglycinamidine cyclo-ligase
VTAVIDQSSWDWPPIFDWLQTTGGIEKAEMLRTFNCGVGMILVVREEAVHDCLASLAKCQETAWRIGHIKPRMRNEPAIEYV